MEMVPSSLEYTPVSTFNKRGFARAVLPHQRMDFTLAERKIHAVKRADTGEKFADPPQFQ